MLKRLHSFKSTVNKYMVEVRPDRLTTCQSERKSTTKCILKSYSAIQVAE
jgi:hypothetical protein